ncbi:MAG: Ig-like domain-containing protein, partial [Ramlibacter sp.]
TIKDAAGNAGTLTLAAPGAANSLGNNKALVIDGAAPTVTSVNSSTANGTYKAGDTVSIQVNFSESVTVTGTPQLTLETGGVDQVVNYASGSGTSTLTFTYTVQAGDTAADLDYMSTTALALNGGTIKDAAGNAGTLTLAAPGAAGSLGNNKAIVIDTTAPTVASVNSSTANGTYKAGDTVSIQVNFSEAVTVTGTPQLTLETGTTDRAVDYASGSGTSTLTFTYTVQAGDTAADLDYLSTTALALNGGTIKDAAGNAGTLTLAAPGAANSLGNNKALAIDSTAPTVAITSNVAAVKIGETATLTFTFSEAPTGFAVGDITATSGTLSGFAVTGDAKVYTATYTPTAGTNKTNASITVAAASYTDAVGNSGGAGTTPALSVDTLAPSLDAAGSAPADNGTGFGTDSDIVIKFSEALDAGSNVGTVTLRDVTTGNAVASTVTINGAGQLVINPTASLTFNSNYYVSWDAGVLKDAAGNTAAGILNTDKTSYNFSTAGAPVASGGPTETVDGASVQTTTIVGADGTTSTRITVAPVSPGRAEDPSTPNGNLADIPLVRNGGNETLLSVGLPTGVGLTLEGRTGPNLGLRQQLINASDPRVSDRDNFGAILQNGIDQYVPTVVSEVQVTVRTLTLTLGDDAGVPASPIRISGTTGTGEDDLAHPNRQEALVIDVRSLPAGTVLQMQNVEFAVIVGAVRLQGGDGRNFAIGDGSSQFMVLGAGNDVLRGGAGDDTVASKAGADQLYGDSGNDIVVGGADSDILEGGAGNDVLQGGQSDAGNWTYQINTAGQIVSSFTAREAVLTDVATLSRTGAWLTASGGVDSDDRLAFSFQGAERLKTVALLVQAVLDRLPTLAELNAFSTAALSEVQLAQLAYNHHVAAHPGIQNASVQAQVRSLVESVWGAGAAADALIPVGVDYINAGGNWAEGLLALARNPNSARTVTDAAGNLNLTQVYLSAEAGWSPGSGDDVLRGGEGNDRLVGGSGSDTLDGGAGIDLGVYVGSVIDYVVQKITTGGVTQMRMTNVHSGDQDLLSGVEYLQIGSRYFDAARALDALAEGQSQALAAVTVELTGQQLQAQGVTLL